MWWIDWKKAENVLGMNARNLQFIRSHNSRRAIRLADDKLATKRLLRRKKIPTVPLLAVFDDYYDVEEFDWTNLPGSFVVKPNHGFGGEGIWVVRGRAKSGWRLGDGSVVTLENIKNHIFDIFEGNYSLGNVADIAYIEEKVKLHKIFKKLTYAGGIPDIRVLVYNMIPVMAMLRLPTADSRGTANLHQGGIGVGIDIGSGITTKAFWKLKGKMIKYYPGTKQKLHGLKVPYWREILEISSACQKLSGLGYLGVDIVLDGKKGPAVLEINARPGMDIQLANLEPLKSRLLRVQGLPVMEPEKAVRLGRELFSAMSVKKKRVEKEKPVLHMTEKVILVGKDQRKVKTIAKVDTGAYRTAICKSTAKKIHLGEPVRKKYVRSALGGEWRDIYKLEIVLQGLRFSTDVFVTDRKNLKYDVIIGRRDLKRFLVDPSVGMKRAK